MAGPDLWTDEFLTAKRRSGDAVGDAAIRRIFAEHDLAVLNRFMGQLVGNDDLPGDLPPEIREFLASTGTLPSWADPERIRAAERLFNSYGLASLISLVQASLPECYTMHTGVRILGLTGQLGEHTNRRLHQTAVMVMAVMGRRGLEADGLGIRQAQKVRLIHAAIRYRILGAIGAEGAPASAGADVPVLIPGAARSVADVIARRQFDWEIERDGFPINQEDLAFTLLTFGFVIPRGLITLGIPLDEEEFSAFLHAWNCVGVLMGVDEDLLAHTPADAAILFTRIKARQAGPSPTASKLTDALLRVVENDVLRLRVLHPVAPVLMRILVGDQTAAMLGLDVRHGLLMRLAHKAIAGVFRTINAITGRLWVRGNPLRFISARLGRRFVRLILAVTYEGRTPQLQIPEGWG